MSEETLSLDTESTLEKKLEAARKSKEAAEVAAREAAEKDLDLSKDSGAKATVPVDDKEQAYSELEKMGCSRNYIARMKEKHGTVIVYPHEDNRWFLVRPLKVKEMKMIREIAQQDPDRLNREILEAGCVFPMLSDEAINDLPAGLPDLLVNMISRLSAFIPVELAFSLSKEL
jgi:hypothetical protein